MHRSLRDIAVVRVGAWTACVAGLLLAPTAHAGETLRPVAPRPVEFPQLADDAVELSCDDGSVGGALEQRSENFYGNRFSPGCVRGRLVELSFTHFGDGAAGPHRYRLHLLDDTCQPLGRPSDEHEVPAAVIEPRTESIDLSHLGWCVNGDFYLLLEPLTCVAGDACYPALAIDASADNDPAAHCAVVSVPTASERHCLAARSTDGRYFDFSMRVRVECASSACTTATAGVSWSTMKRLFHDPAPRTSR